MRILIALILTLVCSVSYAKDIHDKPIVIREKSYALKMAKLFYYQQLFFCEEKTFKIYESDEANNFIEVEQSCE